MRKEKWIACSSLAFFLFFPAIMSAEEIGILPFRTTGVEMYITDAFYDLLENELDYYDHEVVSPYEIERYLGSRVVCYNKDYAADYGRSLGLEKVIFGSITKLGSRYVIYSTVVNSRTGEILLTDKITLNSEEDLDEYVYRLTDSIEEEVYGNVIYYSPTYSRTVTHVYVGSCWRPRIIWRRPRRSSITIRLPIFNINLGKTHHRVVHKSPPKRKTIYVTKNPGKHNHGKPGYREPRYEKREHRVVKKGKREHRDSRDKNSRRDDNRKSKGRR